MCILLKLDYAKFGVSNLFFSKVIDEKPLGESARPLPPPLGKGKVKTSLMGVTKMTKRRMSIVAGLS